MRKTFFSLFDTIQDLLNGVTSVIIALALIGFLWGVAMTLFSQDNSIAKKEGRSFMLYGILTLFVMTSVWGLVNLINGTVTPRTDLQNQTEQTSEQDQGYVGDVSDDFSSEPNRDETPSIQDAQDIFDQNNEEQWEI